jgi:hypothetical protein
MMNDAGARTLLGVRRRSEDIFKKKQFIPWLKENFQHAFIDERIYLPQQYYSILAGMPDVMMIYKGMAFFFELKTKKGRYGLEQILRKEELEKSGAFHICIREDEFQKNMNKLKKEIEAWKS